MGHKPPRFVVSRSHTISQTHTHTHLVAVLGKNDQLVTQSRYLQNTQNPETRASMLAAEFELATPANK